VIELAVVDEMHGSLPLLYRNSFCAVFRFWSTPHRFERMCTVPSPSHAPITVPPRALKTNMAVPIALIRKRKAPLAEQALLQFHPLISCRPTTLGCLLKSHVPPRNQDMRTLGIRCVSGALESRLCRVSEAKPVMAPLAGAVAGLA